MYRKYHAELAQVSLSYSPPEGRLPTCYSPVRRSTQGPKLPFSLDLHVLGTPPALILSQDQTLELKVVPGVKLAEANYPPEAREAAWNPKTPDGQS